MPAPKAKRVDVPGDKVTKRGMARRSPKGDKMRARILDAAEQLYAAHGFEAVSQRDVAEEAGVLSSLITHHYPSKLSLFEAVAGRRSDEINRLRTEQLEAITELTVENILDAFFLPLVDLVEHGGPGWIAYTQIMSKLVYSDIGIKVDTIYYQNIVRRFLTLLKSAMPEVDEFILTRAFLCCIDMLLISIFLPGRFQEIMALNQRAIKQEQGYSQAYAALRPFLLGGLEALR